MLRSFADNRQVHAHFYAIDYDLDLFSNFTYFVDDPVNGDQFEQVDRRTVFGGDFSFLWSASDRLDSMNTVGASFRHDDIGELGLHHSRDRQRLSTIRGDQVGQSSVGLYFQNETHWNDRWRTQFGVRADFYDFDVQSDLAANSGDASDSIVAPKLNIVYALNADSELYLSTGRAFHSNDARGTTIRIDPATGEPANRVDPLVASSGAELGFRMLRQNRLNLSAALWYLELDSELLFVGDAGSTEASRPSRRYGIELPIYYRLNNWIFDLELALTDTRFSDVDPAGDRIPGAIERVVAAGVSTRLSSGIYGSLRLRHFGDRPLIEDGSVRSDSSTVLSMLVGYRRDTLDFRLEVMNLLDVKNDDIAYFYPSRLTGEPTEGIDDIHVHPMEPRALRAALTWSF